MIAAAADLRLYPREFEHGDELGGGRHVAGITYVRGGVRVDYTEGGHGIYSGRSKFSVRREPVTELYPDDSPA